MGINFFQKSPPRHSYVAMSIDGKILVVNGANDSATKEIYHTISEKVSNELE